MSFTHATLLHENCTLHYYYTSLLSTTPPTPLITFIPGGNGYGRQYDALMTALSPAYTSLTFDRRQMSASSVSTPTPLSHAQQARDIHALISTLGYTKSIIFGSSMGGIIALQFATDFPSMVDQLIVHEAPIFSLLPDAEEIKTFLQRCDEAYKSDGIPAAEAIFKTKFIGYDDPSVPPTSGAEPKNVANFWEWEFGPALVFEPDLEAVKANGVGGRTVVMRGVRTGEAWYSRTGEELARRVGGRMVWVPGHHQGYECETEAFLPVFLEVIEGKGKADGGK